MTSGLKLSTAAIALLTVAGLGMTPASAADLGGDCCADLEERIAELEATTARKGNRKVSLTISGQVAKAVMWWDDETETNTYVVDNDNAQSRVRFVGKAAFADGWTAGYVLELGLDTASSDAVSQEDPTGVNLTNGLPTFGVVSGLSSGIEIRQSHWYIESKELGKVSVGRLSMATDDLYKYANLGKAYSDAELHYNGRFFMNVAGVRQTSRWDDFANNLDTSRINGVRYDSPSFEGFVLSAAWGSDDQWDMSLKFKKEFGKITVAAGIGYYEDTERTLTNPDGTPVANPSITDRDEPKDVVGSIGIAEEDTGLYFYGAAGRREFDDDGAVSAALAADDTADYYYGQVGINRKFIDLGKTNIHVDYGVYNDWRTGSGTVADSEVKRIGAGITQNISAAEMDLYVLFNHYYDAEQTTTAGALTQFDDWTGVVGGARINF